MEINSISVEVKNGIAVTSSRTVAEVFEKRHKDVLEQIRNILNTAENSAQWFWASLYKDSSGKSNREYLMTRDGFSVLAMGFTGKKAMQFKIAYINRFNEMERELSNRQKDSYMIEDRVERAKRWIEEEKERQRLHAENLALKPKAEYLDIILQNPNTIPVNNIAQDYGMTAVAFNKLLAAYHIQYKRERRWMLYSIYRKGNYVKMKTDDRGGKIYEYMALTQKGRLFLYEFLKKYGILPLIEREVDVSADN